MTLCIYCDRKLTKSSRTDSDSDSEPRYLPVTSARISQADHNRTRRHLERTMRRNNVSEQVIQHRLVRTSPEIARASNSTGRLQSSIRQCTEAEDLDIRTVVSNALRTHLRNGQIPLHEIPVARQYLDAMMEGIGTWGLDTWAAVIPIPHSSDTDSRVARLECFVISVSTLGWRHTHSWVKTRMVHAFITFTCILDPQPLVCIPAREPSKKDPVTGYIIIHRRIDNARTLPLDFIHFLYACLPTPLPFMLIIPLS